MGIRRAVTILATAIGGAAAVALLSSCDPVPTRHLVVNTFSDGRDAAPGNSVCEVTQGQGDCSLRAAIDEANVTGIRVDIAVPAGIYPLTLMAQYDDDANAVGDLDLTSPAPVVGIHGVGGDAVIDASIDGTGDRIDGALDVQSGTVGIVSLSTTGGDWGLRTRAGATLTAFGGSLHGHTNGGAFVDAGGTFRSSYQEATDNRYHGIASGGVLHVDHDLVARNETGIILEAGGATVADSIIRDNTAQSLLGTGGISAGGIASSVEIDLTVRRTTIAHNVSVIGGGILFNYGTLLVEDSTIVDNSGSPAALTFGVGIGGSSNFGNLPPPTATIARSTITENVTSGSPSTALSAFRGTITTSASVLQSSGNDCAGSTEGGQVISAGFNLFTESTCAFTGPGDQLVADPLLGPLAFNGGLTPTRLPDATSAAVDAIPYGMVGACDATTPSDQRGVTRPVGGACDIGAVERDASP